MTRISVLVIVLTTQIIQSCLGLTWNTPVKNGTAFKKCSGDHVVFPWSYSLGPDDRLDGMAWNLKRKGVQSESQLATFSFDSFSETEPRLSEEKEGSGSVKLRDLTPGDTGSYILYVQLGKQIAEDGPDHHILDLYVYDKPATVSGKLEAKEVRVDNNATTNATTSSSDRSQPRLTCGQFSSLGSPAVSVVWQDPDQIQIYSSGYKDGFFFLDLPAGYSGGDYTCFISDSAAAMGCLPSDSPLKGKVRVGVKKQEVPVTSAGLGVAVIIGILIAVLILVALVVGVVIYVIKFKRGGKSYSVPKEPDSPSPSPSPDASMPLTVENGS